MVYSAAVVVGNGVGGQKAGLREGDRRHGPWLGELTKVSLKKKKKISLVIYPGEHIYTCYTDVTLALSLSFTFPNMLALW